ncbi:MAG: T9SS type A sorting domain-containing protein [Crocinitomicaceae bacterium]|nr:T9SS type A sorting domain-containing protein [Crocinitomicaceae bacterium]
MKKTLLSIALGACAVLNAQTPPQLENPGFEAWETIQVGGSSSTALEPVQWSGLKSSDDPSLAQLSPDGTLTQAVGRDGTGYSIRLETIYTLGVAANGGITNGRFHAPQNLNPEEGYIYTDSTDDKWHLRFSWRPDSLVGWYKYAPTGQDKGKCEVILHTGYGALPLYIQGVHDVAANRVGRARYDWTATTNGQWERFAVAFNYDDSRTPDFILAICTAGDSTISENGSAVWVDDLELVYNNLSVDTYDYNKDFTVYYDQDLVFVNMKSKSVETYPMEVIDMTGKVIATQKVNSNTTTRIQNLYNKGVYFCRINTGGKMITRKIVVR